MKHSPDQHIEFRTPIWFRLLKALVPPGRLFCSLFNLFNSADTRPFNFELSAEGSLLRATGKEGGVFFSRPERLPRIASGPFYQSERLVQLYGFPNITFSPGNLAIDVGANIGEFSLGIRRLGGRVLAIEPDPTEFSALARNLGRSDFAIQAAMWSDVVEAKLYFGNNLGDTSLFGNGSAGHSVTTETLDNLWLGKLNREPVQWLKIEAEGAEPEVLRGGRKCLAVTKFVSVDVSPERNGETTSEAVEIELRSVGFEKFGENRDGLRRVVLYRKRVELSP